MKQNYREWVEGLYREHGLDQDANLEVYKYYDEGLKLGIIPEGTEKEHFKRQCRRVRLFLVKNDFHDEKDDHDILDYNVKLMKKNQRTQDLMRVERKVFRENARVENALVEISKALIEVLNKQAFSLPKLKPHHNKDIHESKSVVVLLSDIHGGECVDLRDNTYNYEVMGKRLKKYADAIKNYAKLHKAKNIIIFSLGDLINADRILQKILVNAESQVKALFTTTYILNQFIYDLATDYKVHYNFVVGNESRINTPMDFTMPSEEFLLSNNLDFAIANILKILFKGSNAVTIYNNSLEEALVTIYGKNFLLTHGHTLDIEKKADVDALVRKYAMKDKKLDAITVGHIHSSYFKHQGVMVVRNSSLVGGNSYSESKGYSSRASQTILIVDSKSITPIPVDLQEVENILGYDYPKSTAAFNCMFDNRSNEQSNFVNIEV